MSGLPDMRLERDAGVKRLSRRAQTRRGAGDYCTNIIITIIRETVMRNPDRRQLPVARARQQRRYHAEDKHSQARRSADYQRRLRAAGIDPEANPPEDMDAFRYQLARMMVMFLNDCEGCPLRLCRRMQGCMAPESTCANNADDPPMTEEEWDLARLEWRRALDAMIESYGGRDAFEAAAEEQARSRRSIPSKNVN
jgi:hypothetical protein